MACVDVDCVCSVKSESAEMGPVTPELHHKQATTTTAKDHQCTKSSGVDLESLQAKLQGTPDFDPARFLTQREQRSRTSTDYSVKLVAHAHLPSRFGENFEMYGFYDAHEDKEHTVMVVGDISNKEHVPVRVHSECHTGDVMGSLRCDCRDQLEESLRYISKQPCGAVLYLKQEGRGIGLLNKIKAYRLQELGLDTVEANLYLGFPDEARDYKVAAKMLNLLKVKSIQLITNNPHKIEMLTNEGINVDGRIPLIIPPNPFSQQYLHVKQQKMGHMFAGANQQQPVHTELAATLP